MTVAQADTALANGDLDGRFAAIGGYWMQYALPCPFPMHDADIQGFCSGGAFADTVDAVKQCCGSGNAPIVMPETLNGDMLWSSTSNAPAQVVLIVHARDSRSWQCEADPADNCQKHMVIDDVAWLNGSATPEPTTNAEEDVQPKMSLDQISSLATKPGEQFVVGYALAATHLTDLDPRLMGQGDGVVWVARTMQPPASSDTAAGTVRLISDADGSLIDELPLAVATGYDPARLVLDSQYSDNSAESQTQFVLLKGAIVMADGVLNIGTPPIAVDAGDYVVRAYLASDGGSPAPDSPTCDRQITLAAGANQALTASFSGSTCSWGPTPTPGG